MWEFLLPAMSGSPTSGGQGLLDMDGVFSPEERERALARLNSLFAWVGARIPEQVELEGRKVSLRQLVNRLINRPHLDEEELRSVRSLEGVLKRREQELRLNLRDDVLSEEEALALFNEARGILRTILRLRELGREERDMEAAVLQQRLLDEKRWVALLRSVGQMK